MKRVFSIDYDHGRRKHRHRCQCCRRIVNTGERVLMVRIPKRTRVVHDPDCANMVEDGMSWRDRFDIWGAKPELFQQRIFR